MTFLNSAQLLTGPANSLADGVFIPGSNPNERYGPCYRGPAEAADPQRWLGNTLLLLHDHPKIRLLALRLTQLEGGAMRKALACYRFVRDLPFGWAAEPGATPSIKVLATGMGDGATKTTLLISLLRSLGIPARAHVVNLSSSFLRGLLRLECEEVPHVFCEIQIEGQWLGVDTYVMDVQLYLKARTRLICEKRSCGYGVHLRGQVAWTGTSSSFCAFSSDDLVSLPTKDLGVFGDLSEFTTTTDARSPSGWARKQHWAIATSWANRRVRRLREGCA